MVKRSLIGGWGGVMASISSRHPPHHVLLRGRENKAALSPLGAQGLTSAAELFPGWGHPALWCLSARPTPRSWCCPGARHGDGCERRTGGRTAVCGEEQSLRRGEDGWRRLTTAAGRKGMKCWQKDAGEAENSPKGTTWVEKIGGAEGTAMMQRNTPSKSVSLNKRLRKEIQTYDTATEGGGCEAS